MMTENEFAREATKIINHIAEIIEEKDTDGSIDIDINGEILTISTGAGTFVINRQTALREIWLSSPVSGPYHFSNDGSSWRSKSSDDLFLILSQDLKIEIKGPI